MYIFIEVFFVEKLLLTTRRKMAKVSICLIISRMKVWSVMVMTMVLLLGIYQMDSFISTHINHRQTVHRRQYYTFDNQMDLNNTITSKYIINCANLDQIQIKTERIRRGRFKTTDVGIVNGQEVAVKYIFDKIANGKKESEVRQFLFMKEIFMSIQLDHPGLIKMLGYCVKPLHENNGRYMSTSVSITAVYEYGEVFNVTTLSLSVEQRIKHVLDLADLLLYLENSPLGSLRIDDFKSGHFLMVNNVIKLIDFDYFNKDEAKCTTKCGYNLTCHKPENSGNKDCGSGTTCHRGICIGHNARINMVQVNKAFFQLLLQEQFFPHNMRVHISNLTSQLNKQTIDALHLIRHLRQLKLN
jgi:protein kinase domain-containing protein